jgi:hypothetical protein
MTATATAEHPPAAELLARYDLDRMRQELSSRGFTVVPELMPRAQAERIGARMKELMALDPTYESNCYYNLDGIFTPVESRQDVDLFVPLMDNPVVHALASHAVGDGFQISNLGGVRLKPRSIPRSHWHLDVPYGWFGQNGRPLPDFCMAITAMWMLSDFTADNGATRVVPYSHRAKTGPIGITKDEHGFGHLEHEFAVEAPAGSCFVFDNAIWHTAGINSCDRERLHITIPHFPQFLDGGNVNWQPVRRHIWQMFPPSVQRLHRHVAEDRT